MKLKLLIAAATVAFAAVPAQAQGLGGTFTGPRIQGQVGWDRTSINVRDTRNFNGRGDFGSPSAQDNSVSYGGELGFDFDLGGFVVGAYGGIDFSDTDEEYTALGTTITFDRNIYAGVRAGVAVSPNALVYGKGGYSQASLENTFAPTVSAANQAAFNAEDEPDGWHYGGGVEIASGSGLYGRLDFTHTKYDDLTLGSLGQVGVTTSPVYERRLNRNQLTLGIGFRF